MYEGSNFSTSSSPLGIVNLFITTILVAVKWYLIVVLIDVFLMATDVKYLFHTC